MFKINKDFCIKCFGLVIVLVLIVFVLYKVIPHKKIEGYDNDDSITDEVENMTNQETEGVTEGLEVDTKLMEEKASACYPKDQLTPDELLPNDTSSTWAQVNPEGQGNLKDKNFLQSGYHIGINTVGQTLRNANLQLRSEPPCPQVQVSPWLQSTIESDVNRKPFEIGGCA